MGVLLYFTSLEKKPRRLLKKLLTALIEDSILDESTRSKDLKKEKKEDIKMARLRNHEKYGKSINCKNFTPFGNNGPSFTIHLFAQETNEETQVTTCAYEIWQREPNKGKRTLVCSGEGFETSDPKNENALIELTRLICEMSPVLSAEESSFFHENYATVLSRETRERTYRVNKKRIKDQIEEVETPTEFQV